jgi:hypothetical protein
MIKVFALLWIVWTVVVKFFGSPRGVASKKFLAEETKMEHQEIVTSTLKGLKEKKAELSAEDYKVAAAHAYKVIKAQYKLILETLEREMDA